MYINFEIILKRLFDNPTHIEEYITLLDEASKSVFGPNDFYERHHILPVSIFPEYKNSKENIIKVSAYQHFMAHYIYWQNPVTLR